MKLASVIVIAALVLLAAPVWADSISGDVSLAGFDSYNSTGVTFVNPAVVLGSSGSLAIMTTVPLVTMSNITSFAAAPGKILFDWNHFGTQIQLTILSLIVDTDNGKFLNVDGTARMSETGFSNTFYDWSLTSTREGLTSFVIDAQPPVVAEPGTLVLVGTALIMLGLARRRFQKVVKGIKNHTVV